MLILLKNTKRNLLWLWLGFSIPILLLFMLQTINGKYEGIVGTAWTWIGINLIPVLGLLLFGAIQNRYPGKPIQVFIFRIIWGFSLLFLLLLLMTLLGMTSGTANQSIESYLHQSYQWLLPFQFLLIVVFFLLYFRKQSIFQPNEKIINDHIQQKAAKAKSKSNITQEEAFDQLTAGDFPKLFDLLKKHFKDQRSDEHSTALLLQSRYTNWKKQTDLNTIAPKEAQITYNQVTLALVDLIEQMK